MILCGASSANQTIEPLGKGLNWGLNWIGRITTKSGTVSNFIRICCSVKPWCFHRSCYICTMRQLLLCLRYINSYFGGVFDSLPWIHLQPKIMLIQPPLCMQTAPYLSEEMGRQSLRYATSSLDNARARRIMNPIDWSATIVSVFMLKP